MTSHSLRSAARALLGVALLAIVHAAPARATKVTFRYQPVIGGVSAVTVAGTFNGWDPKANPLADADQDGIWELALDVAPGRHEYKFVVNGDQWFTDETAADFVPDPYGGKNSVLDLKDQPVVVGVGTTVKKAAPAGQLGLHRVAFRFRPQGKPQRVMLAGTFTEWSPDRIAMADPDGDGEWTVTVLLPTGSHQYKFVVDGGPWFHDPEHQDTDTDDGHGGRNSILNVDDRFPLIQVKRGDGQVFDMGIAHDPAGSDVNHIGAGRVEFTARAHRGDIEGIEVVVGPATGPPERTVKLRLAVTDRVYEYYRGEVEMPDSFSYVFRYRDGAKTQGLTAAGLGDEAGGRPFVFRPAEHPVFATPDWVKHAVIYQIFPERFRNGNPANDPDFREWYYEGKKTPPAAGTRLNTDFQEYYHRIADWNDWKALTQCPWTPDGRDWMGFYGGDIEGVRQSLDYLRDLGVTAIYFNPIFQAKSTHKYDGADYMKVDPHFATNDEFKAFVKEARARGIRIILDIVYNHSGNAHWAFKDAVEKGPASPTYQWFEFKQWPLPAGWPNVGRPWKPADYYYCWWGFGDLPDLNFDLSRNNDAEKAVRDVSQAQVNVPLVNHLLDATEFWLRDMDCDGVRLDVPNEVPYWFWKLFNQRVKKVKPDAYILGELWGNASDYVKPGIYDAVMNYAYFRDPVGRFIGSAAGSAAEFDAALATGRTAYPTQAVAAQMNLIDSHDTVRFLTQVNGDEKRLLLAALFGMTYIGAPTIYYGDEVGMEGGKDPDCRRPFPWDWEKDAKRVAIHDAYRKLAKLRHSSAALRTGDFRAVLTEGMTYGYVRSDGAEEYLVLMNAGRQPATANLDLGPWGGRVRATDALAGGVATWSGAARIELPAATGRIWRIEKSR
jgi:glycosidase